MTKKLTAIAVLIGMVNVTAVYAMSPDGAKAMAQKYRALAQSYEDLAEHYQAIADAGSAKAHPQVVSQNAKAAIAPQKVDNMATTSKAPATSEAVLSPWSDSIQDQKKQAEQSSEVSSASENTKPTLQAQSTAALNSLNLPESIANDNAVSQKKPNIAVANPWKGTSFGLGGSIVTGNSAATNYNGNANISYNPIIPWKNTLVMSYLYNRDDMPDGKGVKTNKFQATGTTSWNFDKNNGIYGRINYLNDQLDTYTYILSESIGYQRQLYSNDTMSLTSSIGPSLTQQKVKDTGEFSNALGAQGGLDYVWNFTDSSSFKQSILVNWTADDATTYQTNSTLSTEIYKNLILQLGFQINGSSWASSNKKRVNTVTSTTIAYSF
ncbi:DUF481 domain-containing protein [Cysteiniphilum halobium]|uniref:DUF481 domain-containing protein n=1 Tax=Cysteiniphilum halobium TaxID=2219059 RepID=UPI000E646A38|nr:DUF481 domain-containing protein [Cysteiniphilum halobium]